MCTYRSSVPSEPSSRTLTTVHAAESSSTAVVTPVKLSAALIAVVAPTASAVATEPTANSGVRRAVLASHAAASSSSTSALAHSS